MSSDSRWSSLASDATILAALSTLAFEELAQQSANDRLTALAALKAAGVAKVGVRQCIVTALAKHWRNGILPVEPLLRERTQIVVSINIHEFPSFVLSHLQHVEVSLAALGHRIILNCNDEMLAALHSTPAAPLCHPVPLNKRRHHGSLLQGIVRNTETALRRYHFDHLLVLSSRSWFRRPVSFEELASAGPRPPSSVSCCDLRYGKERGLYWIDSSEEHEVVELADGRKAKVSFDVFEHYRGTELAKELAQAGHMLLHAPHEGLVLERAACLDVVQVLSETSSVGRNLYSTEAAVEEFALQSLAHSRGHRFGQLSDMGRPDGGSGLGATGMYLPPLTKVVRQDLPV
jgi:hypothetical protein